MDGRDMILDEMARGLREWPSEICKAGELERIKLFGCGWRYSSVAGGWVVDVYDFAPILRADWMNRRVELGLEAQPEPDVTPEEDDAWNEKRMDAIGQNGHHSEVYEVTDVSNVDFDSSKSDGSTASYYELPEGCTELQDLISHRNLNAQDGEIFRAIYRKGRASHSDELRDAKKVLFYAQAEVDRLIKLSEGK